MEMSDKIYISVERTYGASDGQVIAMVTPHNERQSVNDVEYVRKDIVDETIKTAEDHAYFAGQEKLRETLLEWARASYAFKRGVEYGKEEALKGVPRWTKSDRDMHVIRRCLVNWGGEIGTANFIPKDSYYIPIIELEHLLREDSHE